MSNPYQPPTNPYGQYVEQPYYPQQPPQSSGLGITSMCLSIAAMIIVFLMFLFAGYISLQHNHRPPPSQLTLVSLGVLGGTGMAFVGGLLGFIALLTPTQTNGFAAVGLALGIMVVLGVITLLVVGMAFAPPR